MIEDLPGRIENTVLPAGKPLLPLFDALINSIHAIEDRRKRGWAGRGSITISVRRDLSQKQIESAAGTTTDEPVSGFVVEDDGIGFDEPNRESFETADSRYKKARGSKGVGRFLWLKAFQRVSVESTFAGPDEKLVLRTFTFELPNGVVGERTEASQTNHTGTRLTLQGYLEPYRAKCPKSLRAIADRIVEHCFALLLPDTAPLVQLKDDHEVLELNQLAREHRTVASDPIAFSLKGNELRIQHFHVSAKGAKPIIHFLADGREVHSEPPAAPDVNQRIPDGAGGSFVIVSLVSGVLLDRNLTAERTGFTFPRRGDDLLAEEVTIDDLREAANARVAEHAEPLVAPLQAKKMERIEEAIRTQYPQYYPLLRRKDDLAQIPPDLSSDKLEIELHKIRAKHAVETKEKVQDLLKDTVWEGYEERQKQVIDELNDVGKAALIENVVHRRLVLEILAKHLQRRSEGVPGYYLEKDVHRIIFPMDKTSDEVPFEQQNLWVIDERLTFHRYLASDKALQAVEVLNSDEKDRPDLVIWNLPVALSEEPNATTQQAITVIEFKQPMRKNYPAKEEDPAEQVTRYVRKIQSDEAEDKEGRPLRAYQNSPFYAYVLCDLTIPLTTRLSDAGFLEMPDRSGYFFYNPNRRLWIEVLSYSKVVEDARKRNRALFEALGLPTG
jgi:hypothetical protein